MTTTLKETLKENSVPPEQTEDTPKLFNPTELEKVLSDDSFKKLLIETLEKKNPKEIFKNLKKNREQISLLINKSNLSQKQKDNINNLMKSVSKISNDDDLAVSTAREVMRFLVSCAATKSINIPLNLPLASAIITAVGVTVSSLTGDKNAGNAIGVGSTAGMTLGGLGVYFAAGGAIALGSTLSIAAIPLGALAGWAYYRFKKHKKEFTEQIKQQDLTALGDAIVNGAAALPDWSKERIEKAVEAQHRKEKTPLASFIKARAIRA